MLGAAQRQVNESRSVGGISEGITGEKSPSLTMSAVSSTMCAHDCGVTYHSCQDLIYKSLQISNPIGINLFLQFGDDPNLGG
jgi:hypothetical protein